ncbi:cytochrome b N-terminal domain-containing protein [Desulfovibrio ferrophilus]|uniref:Cytochrome b/b6 family protein n=1 Tax=Desulfovibrio ferrophilus TaxID=241368 RepID=A0A2Z6AZ80_9BACT|nr:cytochrome b N-terminal domain-containing protein [Desulfovibrio ferrophilus]BBD08485.1 cytochrome b/b6 family protein [Desulfovibrio ferrophilus]
MRHEPLRQCPCWWKLLSGLFLPCLIISLSSGLVLLFQYRPQGNVFQSVEHITTLVPYGFFFRRLHFASGQACALLALIHVTHHLAKGASARTSLRVWLRLTGGLGICFLLLLTGFILKGDQESVLAGTILKNLAGAVPLVGAWLAPLAVGEGQSFFLPPYIAHCFILPVALLALLHGHLRSWRPDNNTLAIAALLLGGWTVTVPLGLPAPPGMPVDGASGPWFLLGLQELLRLMPPLWGGIILPGLFFVLVAALPILRGRWAKPAHYAVLICVGLYLLLELKRALA